MNRDETPSNPGSVDSVDLMIAESTCGLDAPDGLRSRVEGAIGRSQRRRRRRVAGGGGIAVLAVAAVTIVAIGQRPGPGAVDPGLAVDDPAPMIDEELPRALPEPELPAAAVRFAKADNVLASPQQTTDPRITVVLVYPIGPAFTSDDGEAGEMGVDSNRLHQQVIQQRSEL